VTIDLTTTNALLAVLATVAVLEAVAVVALFVCALLFYRRVMRVLAGIEERQLAPLANRVRAILDDVQGVTSKVAQQAEQLERLAHWVATSAWNRRGDKEDAG
jgi:hypothetical protein